MSRLIDKREIHCLKKRLTFFVATTSQNSFSNSVLLQLKCIGSTFSCIQAYVIVDTLVTLMLVWLVGWISEG